jgi:hypothetical protein
MLTRHFCAGSMNHVEAHSRLGGVKVPSGRNTPGRWVWPMKQACGMSAKISFIFSTFTQSRGITYSRTGWRGLACRKRKLPIRAWVWSRSRIRRRRARVSSSPSLARCSRVQSIAFLARGLKFSAP